MGAASERMPWDIFSIGVLMIFPDNLKGFDLILAANSPEWSYLTCCTFQKLAKKNGYRLPKNVVDRFDPSLKYVDAGILTQDGEFFYFTQDIFKRNKSMKGNKNQSLTVTNSDCTVTVQKDLTVTSQSPHSEATVTSQLLHSEATVTDPVLLNNILNKEITKSRVPSELVSQIVEYLNLKAKKNFKANNQKTSKLISVRMKEGFSVDDFKAVVDNQCAKWLHDPKMIDYLRPETLFGTKFESYLNSGSAQDPLQPLADFFTAKLEARRLEVYANQG